MRNWTSRTIGLTVILVGVAIAAVAQLWPTEPVPDEIAPPVATTESVAGGAPEGESTPFEYRVGLLAGPTTDNYWEYVGDQPTAWNAYVLGPTKPALYAIDPTTNALTPELATGQGPVLPTWDEDGWRVRLQLEKGPEWSDGEPITADDVVYTFETVRRLGLGGGWADSYPAEIEEIVAESPTDLRIEFSRRPGLGLWPHGVGLAPIMPAHVWAPLTDEIEASADLYALDAGGDVSGGPLEIMTIGDDRVETAVNPGYAAQAVPAVTYSIFTTEEAAVSALKVGQIDTILDPNGLSGDGASDLAGTPGIAIERSPANAVRYLGFNLTREPMARPQFRQSLALLLDRGWATETLVPDADPAYTVLSSSNASWFDQEQAAAISEPYGGALEDRVATAVSGLQGAGYAWETPPAVANGALVAGVGLTIDGQEPAPLTILTPGDEYDPARPDYTTRIEATLENLGFDVRPVVTDFDTVVDLAFTIDEEGARQYDMYVLGWTLGNPALPDYHQWLFATDGAANSTGYSNPDFDANLSNYLDATVREEAKTALWGMEQAVARDLPYLVLYHPNIIEAYRSDRVRFGEHGVLGGIQGRLGGLSDLSPVS